MKLQPLADRVILKMTEAEEKTKSGIIITGTAKEKPQVAEVIEVGPGGLVDGKEVVMTVAKGDKVVTIGGVHGVIQSVRESAVILKVDENCKIEFSRSAIASVKERSESSGGESAD